MFQSKRKLYIFLIAVFCICLVLGMFASCKNDNPDNTDDTKPPVDGVDYGIDNVYFTTDGDKEYTFSIVKNTFTITGLNGEQKGTFTYKDGALTLSFDGDTTTTASATIENGVLKLTYNGASYRMLLKKQFTVAFNTSGGSSVESQQVMNGGHAAKPQDPTKDGYIFVGWYADEDYKSLFAFDSEMITADTTVYARFVKQSDGKAEYTVTLVCDGTVYDPVKTVNGVLYNLPTPTKEGAEFAGWWMSDYQSADKLTCQYTDQKLTQDVALYAVFKTTGTPLVSVTGTKVTWQSLGATLSYRITIMKGDKTIVKSNVGTNEFPFDFSAQEAGEYTVTVECNGKSSTAYVKNKVLDRVSNFRVVNGVLLFDPVAHAEKYIITVKCGTAGHDHTNLDNGNSTNYVFSFCDMAKDGISFVVTAKAEGYLDSTNTFTYFLGLDKVSDVKLENGKLVWKAVENAEKYLVELSTDGIKYTSEYVTAASYDATGLDAGTLYVKVTPVTAGYYSEPATAVQLEKKALAMPSGVSITGNTLSWNAVKGARSYKVEIDGKVYDASTNSIALAEGMLESGKVEFGVRVMAVGATEAENSPYTAVINLKYGTMGKVSYANGTVTWDPVLGAAKYFIKVGDKTFEVTGDKSSFGVTFESAGNVDVAVCFADSNGSKSSWVTVTVKVFAIEFDSKGGSAVATLYKAVGDPLTLSESKRDGFEFVGWFATSGGIAEGKPFSETVYTKEGNTVLYADWTAKTYNAILVPGDNAKVDSSTADAVYGKMNNLPLPTHTDTSKIFVGWFSEPNGAGLQYTNEKGEALLQWVTPGNVKLYAFYIDSLKYLPINDGKAYAVKKGDLGIGNVTSIKIPTHYNGLPVTAIEAGAFSGCSTLVEIHIPSTITRIDIGTDGVNGAGSAFEGCSKLTAINIYDADAVETLYVSYDGVLYYHNPYTGFELKCIPAAKEGTLNILEGAEIITANVFKASKITEVHVPYTVTSINSQAFNASSKITKITFKPTPDYATARMLTIEDSAIISCSSLTELVLPARLAAFTTKSIQKCLKFTSIDIEEGDGATFCAKGEDGRKVICTADGKTLIYCPTGMEGELSVPQGVIKIDEKAFESCSKLETIHITETVSTISKEAFSECIRLTTIDLGGKDGAALSIGEKAFFHCNSVTELTIPERVIKIEKNAFGKTTKLVKVTVNAAGAVADDAPEGTPASVDFATNAFGTDDVVSVFYVTNVVIGKDVPVFDIPGVFGQKIATVTVDKANANYSSQDGVLFDKNVTRIIYYPTSRKGDYVIPETVTELGDRVFQGRSELTGITIGSNVKSIGQYAFNSCSKLAFVKFTATPDGTAKVPLTMGDSAFRSCTGLLSIELPDRLVSIGQNAFTQCTKLTEVRIPDGTTTIGTSAFSNCYKLETVTLPKNLEKLGNDDGAMLDVFPSCTNLQNLTISEDNIYYATIDNILYRKSESTKLENGKKTTVYVPTKLLYCPQSKAGATDIVILDSVIEIGAGAFYSNSVVTSITFGKLSDGKDLVIGDQAFFQCKKLAKVTLPEGLGKISEKMFYNCTSIQEIVIPSTVETIESNAFYYCTALSKLTFAPTPEGQTPVELKIVDVDKCTAAPFRYCSALKEITFPERLTYIGKNAFGGGMEYQQSGPATYYDAYVEKVYLPSTLKRIGANAFTRAIHLTTVVFADGTVLQDAVADGKVVPAIGDSAFEGCTALVSFKLPAPKTGTYSLGDKAFYNYISVPEFTIPANVVSIGENCFYRSNISKLTFAEGATPSMGKNAFASSKIESLVLPEGITEIADSAFLSCTSLKSVVIPKTVVKIGASAFSGCTKLETLTLLSDDNGISELSEIGNSAFSKTIIKTFRFPTLEGTATLKLGASLFSGCTELDSVYLSKSVGSVANVFNGCNNIKNFVVDPESQNFSSVPGSPVLYNKNGTAYKYICGLITGSHTIPVGVTEINENVFLGQVALTELYIPYTVQIIGKSAFEGCTSLKKVVFEHSAEHPSQLLASKLGTRMFYGCASLEDVALPDNLTSIPSYIFYNCTSLTKITLPSTLTAIDNDAFEGAGLTEITIPATVKTIGNYAFKAASKGNGSLVKVIFEKDAAGNCALTSIGTYAFRYQALPSFVLPKSVTSLGSYAFADNTELTAFTFEEGTQIKEFGTYLFQNCTSLPTFTVPKSVTTLGNYDFDGCTALTEVLFEEGSKLTATGTYTFRKSGLVSITFPDSLVFVGTTKATAPSATSSTGNLFEGCESLTTVTFGNKVTHINAKTFLNCTALTTVNIPDSVSMICASAFQGCTSLKSIEFGKNSKLMTLGASVFAGSGLEKISIPAGVTMFGSGSTSLTYSTVGGQFSDCVNLKSVEFLGDVTKIGASVFMNCTALTEIKIPESVTLIGKECFSGCSALKTIDLGDKPSLDTLGSYTFKGTAIESFVLPAGVTLLGNGSTSVSLTTDAGQFSDCANLKSIEFKGQVTKIGAKVFMNCTSLTEIKLPESVTHLGGSCFMGCTSLTSVTWSKNLQQIGANTFDSCTALKSVTLNEGITSIGKQAFYGSGLESISIPKSCKTITEQAFGACHNLASFTVAAGNEYFAVEQGVLVKKGSPVTILAVPGTKTGKLVIPADATLGANFLNGHTGITEVILMEGITKIPAEAFAGANISKITLPSTLTEIGSKAFKESALTSVEIPAAVTTIYSDAFRNCEKLEKVTFAEGSKLTKLNGTYVFAGTAIREITLPESLIMLGLSETTTANTFSGCKNLTSVKFLGKIVSLNGSFVNCTSLKSFTIPETVTSLGSSCFSGSGLESIVIPSSITGIGTYAFSGCTALKSVVIPASVTEIGNSAFTNCTALESVNFEDSSTIEKFGTGVFSGSGIKTFAVPQAIVELPTNTFKGCTSLTDVTFLGAVTKIGSSAFEGCTALESFTIPGTVKDLGSSSFKNSGLKSIVIPANVTSSNSSVFEGCEQLETVVFEEGMDILGSSMFKNCVNLKSVKLSSTTEKIYASVFYGCTSIETIVIPATVSTAFASTFYGWTSEQTICFEGDQSDYSSWGSTWTQDCEAKLVYNYKAE